MDTVLPKILEILELGDVDASSEINVIQEVLKEITSSNAARAEGLDNEPGHNDDEKWPPESNRADTGLLSGLTGSHGG